MAPQLLEARYRISFMYTATGVHHISEFQSSDGHVGDELMKIKAALEEYYRSTGRQLISLVRVEEFEHEIGVANL